MRGPGGGWERGEWRDRGGAIRPEYRNGLWVVSQGCNNEEAKAGRPWALSNPARGHESYHRTAREAMRAKP